ncbi:MAG: peptide chain release factor N(5)-glutamine methyltransferase [Clostridiales bacterium]|jgi:release factor glutamine methyltransferase|nr:peptide chain release factor N(5)-glutamine methyltransferase [Clostridiales bacterium]
MSLLLKDILNIAETRFKDAGCLTPRLDAEILFCHLIKRDRSYLFLHYGDEVTEKTCEEYFKLIDLRASGKPVQYIIGYQEFMGLKFIVNESVLIPRQDTELLVETAIDELRKMKIPIGGLDVLDLCCGSGAIAVSLAYHMKGSKIKIMASDVSAQAIEVAKSNAKNNGVSDMIDFKVGDLFGPFPKNRKGKGKKQFNLIISNPPYIKTDDLSTLMREVREHEPMLALDGGDDGLDFYRRIINEAHSYLKPGGVLLLEIGYDQGQSVPDLIRNTGYYNEPKVLKDLAGHNRVVLTEAKHQN